MDIWTQEVDLVVTCGRGLLMPTMQEVSKLGYKPYNEGETVFCVRGTMKDAMYLNLWSRCAHRILFPVLLNGFARNLDDLYYALLRLPWENWLDPEQYLTVNSAAWNDTCRDTRMPTLKTKDAVVDRLRQRLGRRPDAGAETHGAAIFTYWNDTTLHCFLDTTGEPLSRRGYRMKPWRAPMQETLAAAMLIAARYDGHTPLVVPMCGSGTPVIEAALIAKNRAPGSFRHHFAFMALAGYGDLDDAARLRKGIDRGWYRVEQDYTLTQVAPSAPPIHAVKPSATWSLITAGARANELPDDFAFPPIIASDIAPEAIDTTRDNARAAGVTPLIQTHVCDFALTPLPAPPATLFMNPEYGQRLGSMDTLPATYQRIGDFLKTRCQGYTVFILSGDTRLSTQIPLKATRVLPCHNGPIDCTLLEFDIYHRPDDHSQPNPTPQPAPDQSPDALEHP